MATYFYVRLKAGESKPTLPCETRKQTTINKKKPKTKNAVKRFHFARQG